jgi:hypothetical protein
MSFLDSTLDEGITVNVNGSYGQLTRDPVTGKLIADVNTTGRPVYGQQSTGSPISNAFAGLPGWAPMAIVFALFILAAGMVAGRK